MADLTPVLLKACLALAPKLKEEDFMFSVEANGKTWDVYKVVVQDQVGQIAFYMEDGQVCFGWIGPRLRSPADIQHLLAHGFTTTIPDA